MSNTMSSSASGSSAPNPSEVGWQFVPQYYTFVNKQPQRLHCFYAKTSTFSHGTEGEDGRPCYGQQEIHNKIISIGFQDCKVFIHSVDAQASANNGIIIQVIGEMSNKGEAWRKFVQTFFLAEQPNGYFVLNDIFRFLKEESVDDEDGSEGAEADNLPAPNVEPPVTELAPPSSTVAPVETVPDVAVPHEVPSAPAPEPVRPQPNGYHYPNADKDVDGPPSPVESIPQVPEPEPVVELEPVAPAPAAPPQAPAPPVQSTQPMTAPPPAAPVVSDTTPQNQTHAPPSAPSQPTPTSPPAPHAPKTWANLAATNSKKWGAAVAQESRGLSEVVAPTTPTPSAPASGTQTPVTTGRTTQGTPQGRDREHREPHPAVVQANSLTTPQVFVKGVTEPVSNTMLTQVLTNRFGPIKDVEIVRSKACAFLEFINLEHAKRAIVASLPVNQGGDGGIRIDVADGGNVRIIVETKKERGERPPPRPRGGAPGNGEQRGGFRGGRGGGGRGRGGGGGGGGGGQQAGK